MRKQFLGAVALVIMALACAGEAGALVQRTFVSGLGSDANPCTRTEPCRTFQAAIAQTLPGGEVVALDSAGYGPVTIAQAISLIAPPGIHAGVTTTVGGTDAITIGAGASDVVVLKGLSVTGLGLGDDGIVFTSGKALQVEDVTISGFVSDGILFGPAATAQLTVRNSSVRDNAFRGIVAFAPLGHLARVTIDRSAVARHNEGVAAYNRSRVSVRDTVVSGNAFGFYLNGDEAVMSVENCFATHNEWGIASFGLARVAGTTVSGNVTGLFSEGSGSILSRGNNTVEGNDTDGAFTNTFAAK